MAQRFYVTDSEGQQWGMIDYGRSVFNGQMGGGMRRIAITGTATLNTSLSSPERAEQFLRGLFEAQGWTLINFNFTKTGFWTATFSINIEALVPDDYTNQQHTDQAALLLSSYEVSYGVGSTRAITDIYLTSNSPDRAGAMTAAQSGQPASSGGNPNQKPDGEKDEWTKFWEQLQRDLMVSSSTILVGGVVLLVVMLRK